jgi:Kef-type K+ transport system membrane component KefB
VIALDDAWGILTFSVLLAGAAALGGAEPWSAFGQGAWEVFGAVLLGIAAGLPMAYLTGRLNPGRPTLAEALGFVALVAGAAVWMGASALLAAVVLGVVVANLAQHHDRPVHAIEGVEWPFLIVFFLLAGAELRLGQVAAVAPLIVAYVLLRVSGRLAGGWAGVRLSGERPNFRPWMGPALLPQAGVGLGLALLAAPRFPELGSMLLSIVVGSTVLFELAGPLATRWALRRVGETPS